jgi:hypothetical protein
LLLFWIIPKPDTWKTTRDARQVAQMLNVRLAIFGWYLSKFTQRPFSPTTAFQHHNQTEGIRHNITHLTEKSLRLQREIEARCAVAAEMSVTTYLVTQNNQVCTVKNRNEYRDSDLVLWHKTDSPIVSQNEYPPDSKWVIHPLVL